MSVFYRLSFLHLQLPPVSSVEQELAKLPTEAGRWGVQGQPGLHIEILSQKTKEREERPWERVDWGRGSNKDRWEESLFLKRSSTFPQVLDFNFAFSSVNCAVYQGPTPTELAR
jgi:hypothetical protein